MIKYLLTILAAASPFLSNAQPSECEIISFENFGGDGSESFMNKPISILNDGRFSINMVTNSTIATSVRTDCVAAGNLGLLRIYNADYTGLPEQQCAAYPPGFTGPTVHVLPQPGGDTIFVGTVYNDAFSNDIALRRVTATGAIVYDQHYGGSGTEAAYLVSETTDGNFFVLSGTNSDDGDVGLHYGEGLSGDAWIVKFNPAGEILWSKVLGGSGWDVMSAIIPSEDGGCHLFGASPSNDYDATGNHGNMDLWIVKMDSEGNKQWHKMLGGSLTDGSGADGGVKAVRDSGDGFYVACRTGSTDGDVQNRMPVGEEDFWVLHIDSAANVLWENTYGGPGLQYVQAFCRAADGSLWVAGAHLGDETGGDITADYFMTDGWVAHIDSMGNLLNQRTIGGHNEEHIYFLHPLPDGTVLAGGLYLAAGISTPRTQGFPIDVEGIHDIFIVRLGPDNALSADSETKDVPNWNIYPNPADKMLYVSLQGNNRKPFLLNVTDSYGKAVLQSEITHELTIKTASWVAGTYMITLTAADGSSETKKIAVQH